MLFIECTTALSWSNALSMTYFFFLTLLHNIILSWDFMPIYGNYRVPAEVPCLDGAPYHASGKHY